MNPSSKLSEFSAHLCREIQSAVQGAPTNGPGSGFEGDLFGSLALELFGLQFSSNLVYRRVCEFRGITPANIKTWDQIPAIPTSAFKEFDVTSILPEDRITAFHTSGTTLSKPGKHFHSRESLALYELSLWHGFAPLLPREPAFSNPLERFTAAILTPDPAAAPHSSLVHMFDTIRVRLGLSPSVFLGSVDSSGAWVLDFGRAEDTLHLSERSNQPALILGTAFLFVHLLDRLAGRKLAFRLPKGSLVVETGGYKGRSRELSKADLHNLLRQRFGLDPGQIITEYGMSELSSQAYEGGHSRETPDRKGAFRFSPWARSWIVSPETGLEAREGETGLIRVIDLANAYSVMAVQTGDLGIRRGAGFELAGRVPLAEARGCSLMAA